MVCKNELNMADKQIGKQIQNGFVSVRCIMFSAIKPDSFSLNIEFVNTWNFKF